LNKAVRVALTGAAGRMGRAIVEACRAPEAVVLTAAVEREGSPAIGADVGEIAGIGPLGVKVTDRLAALTEAFDVLIDFSQPEATLAHLAICRQAKRRMVIGTTGIAVEGRAMIQAVAEECAIVWSPNMSIGVNLCFKLLELAARVLGDEVDIEVIEAHHRHKRDAPSGTALRMGEIVAERLGRELKQCAVYGRQSRLLKRLRLHGLIKRVARSYRYYLTAFSKHVIATGLKLKELVLIPQLALATSR
jgi:4-hydroxy-tetrahydrodipicolinate reductase